MIDLAYAQAGGPATGPHPVIQFLPLILVFVVFYFLLIRPQQKKSKERQDMIGNLKRNDEVLTTGGLYGKIVEVNEKMVTLEIAPKINVRVDRQHIDALVSGAKASKTSGAE
ncbi:MAG: preprotein translocase subunit YajC [Candidatus Binatia bacterium]